MGERQKLLSGNLTLTEERKIALKETAAGVAPVAIRQISAAAGRDIAE